VGLAIPIRAFGRKEIGHVSDPEDMPKLQLVAAKAFELYVMGEGQGASGADAEA